MFRHVCICGNPAPITFNPVQPLKMNFIPNVPVLIIAANRPQYLFRTLTSVLNAIGVQKVRLERSLGGSKVAEHYLRIIFWFQLMAIIAIAQLLGIFLECEHSNRLHQGLKVDEYLNIIVVLLITS